MITRRIAFFSRAKTNTSSADHSNSEPGIDLELQEPAQVNLN